MLILSMMTACKVVDAPENLEDLMVFGFVNFNEDEKYLEETAEQLLPLINRNEDDLFDGYRVSNLTKADLSAVGVDPPEGKSDILGAMGLVDYTNNVDRVVDAVSRENKHEMFPENFLDYNVLEGSDRSCFLSAECDRLDQEVYEKTKVALLGEAERTYNAEYRWINTEELGDVVFVRQIAPEEMKFSSNLAIVHQQYSFVMLYKKGGKARRVEAFWVDVEVLNLDVPDSYGVDQAVSQMEKQAERIDAWIDANK